MRCLTLPLEYAVGFALLVLFLPGWWELLAILPVLLAWVRGVARVRKARWPVDDQSVVLPWGRLLSRTRSSPTAVVHN